MTDLHDQVDAILKAAFDGASLPTDAVRCVPTTRPGFGDLQCNTAMALAKAAGRKPRDIAEDVAGRLRGDAAFASVEVAGPGFLNLTLGNGFVSGLAREQAASPHFGIAQVSGPPVLLDFGGPNVAKPLHVGHLRSLVIGESLARILRSQGLGVITDIHLGDWGLQMGMLIAAVRAARPGLSPGAAGAAVDVDEMERLYPAAAAACKMDPARLAEARALTAALQSGDAAARADWAALRATSLADQMRDVRTLDTRFDLLQGESDAQRSVERLVADLARNGVAAVDGGALVIDVAGPSDAQPLPPLILAKGDGAATYATTDLATIVDRMSNAFTGDCGRHVYVVDARQSLHFEQVFRAARKAGLATGVDLVHVGFGTVNGSDGKPFRTREGGVARLRDLLAEAVGEARKRIDATAPGIDADRLAEQVGIGAVKWADLSTGRMAGYAFDADRMVSFEGDTGPYVQYACVRIGAMAAKARAAGARASRVSVGHPAEKALALACLGFPRAVGAAAAGYAPDEVAKAALAVAHAFSRFYAECPVLAAPEAERASRLALCKLAHTVSSRALWMLGIEIPERM